MRTRRVSRRGMDVLCVRGRVVEDRDSSFIIEGGIHLAATGEELTRARGRFFPKAWGD